MHSMIRFVLGLLVLIAAGQSVQAQLPAAPGDWPGWRGAARTNLSKETGLLKSWPPEGPPLLWKAKGLGRGYGTPSIAKGVLYVLGTEPKNNECVIALDIKDGTQLWSTPFGKADGGNGGSTPTIDGDSLYVISSNGVLISASVKSGQINWRKDFEKEFGGQVGGWRYCESPLIDGDVLVATPGGESAAIVALNKKTGEVIWKSDMSGLPKSRGNYAQAEYSSVIVGALQGVKQYIQFLHGGVVGLDAKTGKLLWHYDRPANGTANASTPLQFGDAIFAASNYGNGGGLANIVKKDGKLEAKEAFFVKQMQNHHGGMVLLDGFLYGTNNDSLLCVDMKTGKIAWQDESVGKGAITYADGHLYLRSERGPVALVEANPTAYKEKGRFDQPGQRGSDIWPHPVVAGGKLYLRDREFMYCYDVKEK
jgi:outer membrane protein assembly factor BamB